MHNCQVFHFQKGLILNSLCGSQSLVIPPEEGQATHLTLNIPVIYKKTQLNHILIKVLDVTTTASLTTLHLLQQGSLMPVQ